MHSVQKSWLFKCVCTVQCHWCDASEAECREARGGVLHSKVAEGCVHVHSPTAEQFQVTLEMVTSKGAAAGRNGLASVGKGKNMRTLILCLGESSKRKDQRFMKEARSVTLLRDARDFHLCIRFISVNHRLEIRRGMLGTARCTGSTSVDKF